MPRRRPDATIVLTTEQRQELESVVRARTSTQALEMRPKIVLLTAEGLGPRKGASDVCLTARDMVHLWRRQFEPLFV